MPIYQSGALNTSALNVPDLYVNIVAPQVVQLNGVPTNIVGAVGTASWGPKNSPTPFSDMQGYIDIFGPVQARKYDMGTLVSAAVLQLANNFRGVRVTDGTDAAAVLLLQHGVPTLVAGGTGHVVGDQITMANGAILQVATVSSGAVATFTVVKEPTAATAGTVLQSSTTGAGAAFSASFVYTTGCTITSLYTGTAANGDTVTIAAGSAAGSYRFTISRAGRIPEVFDNISGTGNALWVNLAAAINNGQSGLRSASKLVVATAGAGTAVPLAGSYALAGGTDGVTTITAAVLLGTDGTTRTGMYALRNNGVSLFGLADADTQTSWSAQAAFSTAIGAYGVVTGPAGETASAGATAKATAAIDTYGLKVLLGDWVYFNDPATATLRLISPQGFALGRLANLGPHQSGLNKPMQGIVATQKTYANQTYSDADLGILATAGIDVITAPSPGGDYFALRFGHNASSNIVVHGDNYTRMTNYLAATILAGLGVFIGELQSPKAQRKAKATLETYLSNLQGQEMIGNADGTTPYLVTLGPSNNPSGRVTTGYMQADVKVQYLSVIENFIVNIEGGQTVDIQRGSLQLAA